MNAQAMIAETAANPPDRAQARPASRLADIPRGEVACLLAVACALVWAYSTNLASLVETWYREPDYTHGFLVLPIAAFIFWKRWPAGARPSPWWPGWALVIVGLAARSLFLEQARTWLESATMLLVVAGLGLARLGPRLMLRLWPAFAFLLFLYPLPTQLNAALAQPLQNLATTASCFLLRLTGLWVMPEGNVIMIGNERLEVAAACNGLSMLMSLAATVTAAASLIPMANYKRIVLMLSIIPIALGSNILRISATAWCYYEFGADVGGKYAHDAAGYLMMPTAMALVGLELWIMSWLVVESKGDAPPVDRIALERLSGGPAPVPVPNPNPKPGVRS